MIDFNNNRNSEQADEIWFLQHPSVYTLGLNRKHAQQQIIDTANIPIIETNRGGQLTYHGLGQLVVYLLIDLRRKAIGIRDYVHRLEQSVIDMLADDQIVARRQQNAPGVYINAKKISAIGIRISKMCSYHGISINVNMDMSPYKGIHPCGYADLEMTQTKYYGIDRDVLKTRDALLPHLLDQLEYSQQQTCIIK